MILDNENYNQKVHQWLTEYTIEGKLSIVSGYFTIGALAFIAKELEEKVSNFKFVLGEMVDWSSERKDALDLLNEDLSIEGALKLSSLANEAVNFLQLEKTSIKTLEPNFCHAKAYIFKSESNNAQKNYYITGSSNLTEAGMGLTHTNNLELNHADFGAGDFTEYLAWFESLWNSPKAHNKKTIRHENGTKEKIDFKEYIIQQIKRVFEVYTPKEIYYKILFELYGAGLTLDDSDAEFNRKIGRLENTIIWKRLYEFQQKGVKSLIRMMDKYGGAILADAVGLGKTWTSLAVIKHYETEGYQTVLLCPKKLEQNWRKFFEKDNLFYRDGFDYTIRFHTDLQDERWEHHRYRGRDKFDRSSFNDSKPKLVVIDESHNLRNDKSARYKWFVEELLKQSKGKLKVLLLSATPINNSMLDLRNQFKLLVRGNEYGLREADLMVNNIDYVFRGAQRAMNEWQEEGLTTIGKLIDKLPPEFRRMTDGLLVARNRKWVESIEKTLHFPKKAKPVNIFVTPKNVGNFESFEELFDSFPDRMSAYLPSFYIEEKVVTKVIEDERQREHFLVKMMQILMTKRLESCWKSLYNTAKKILDHHQNALNRVKEYETTKKDVTLEHDELINVEDHPELEKYTLGKKRTIGIMEIDKAGKLKDFKHDLKEDISNLNNLIVNINSFSEKLSKETLKTNNYNSCDTKLEKLIEIIRKKQLSNHNQKIVIFSVYYDTVEYLFEQLIARGFKGVAMVSGGGSKTDDSDSESKYFGHILERFAPYTKLFNEKNWEDFNTEKQGIEAYEEWLGWLKKEHPTEFEKTQQPINILIATDTLSEGQNLQDCDMVINYDIHWNPVRVIQRMGRIDRLGSPNNTIFGVNFWPTKNIDDYLYLKERIEMRMAAMRLAGAEVPMQFTDEFAELAEDEKLEKHQEAQMLKLMEHTIDEQEMEQQALGLDDFSMENFRQELEQALSLENKYRDMPRGVFSGIEADDKWLKEAGIIALLGYPHRPPNARNYNYKRYELVYLRPDGSPVFLNIKDLLNSMSKLVPDALTHIAEDLRAGNPATIDKWRSAIETWINNQRSDSALHDETNAGNTNILGSIAAGDLKAVKSVRDGDIPDNIFKTENFDLVCWLLVEK